MIWAPRSIWKVFQLVRAIFGQFGAGPVTWGGLTAPGDQMFGRRSNHPGQCEQKFALSCIPVLHCCIGSGGVCFGSGGACICAGGSLWCSSFGLVVCALCLSMVLSRMCRVVSLA
jgi:hypothetical protein